MLLWLTTYFILATVWLNVHLPFIMAYVLAGASLSKLVLAHDCNDTDVETLGELYVKRSEEKVPSGLRWFYCCGLGIALLCMSNYYLQRSICASSADLVAFISVSHIHKEIEGQRIPKKYRLAVRAALSIILLCLPLAHELSSLELISTTTGLVALAMSVDLYGSTSVHDDFWKDKRVCKYSADCSAKKRDIEAALKMGETIAVEELAEGTQGEKCAFE